MSNSNKSFSNIYPNLLTFNKNSRLGKAKKILAVLNEEVSMKKLKYLSLLDVGCSEGLITSFLSNYLGTVIGIDTDKNAIDKASKHKNKNVSYETVGNEILPFKNNSFDIVLANHLYEHVGNPQKIYEEISRVLKPDGFCYSGTGNKLVLIDAHYPTLPLISLLPISLANLYVKIAGKGSFYEPRLKTIFGIRKMFKNFNVSDYTIKIIKNPRKYHYEDAVGSFIPRIPTFIVKLLYPFISDFIYVLREKKL